MSVELGPDEIKEIVRDYLEKKTGKRVKSVTIEVGNVYQGYGTNEAAYPTFKHITAQLEDAPLTTPRSIPPELDPPSLR
jgi:hypothetical protein